MPGQRGAWVRLRFAVESGRNASRTVKPEETIQTCGAVSVMAADILIVDDEADICELVSGILQDEGYSTRAAHDSDAALGAIASRRPNLVFLDIWLQGSRLDGLQLLDAAKGATSRSAGGDDFRTRQYRNRRRRHQARRL